MNRALPVALVLAVALVAAGAVPSLPAAGADDPGDPVAAGPAPAAADSTAALPVVDEPNTSNYLAPPDGAITASAVTAPDLDVGGAVAADATRLAVRFRVGNVLAVYRSAETDAARDAVVRQYFRRIENATGVLERRERAALAAYNDGEYSAERYLRELARIDAAADRLLTTLGQVEELADPDYPVAKAELGAVRIRLRLLRGPIRERVGAAVAGTASPVRVHIETTGSAVVLAAVLRDGDGPTYVREAYLPGRRDPGAIDQYGDLEGVLGRLDELYPWVARERTNLGFDFGPPPAQSIGATSVYSATYTHLHGRLSVLFDGGTDRVFYEVQRKDLGAVPRGRAATNTSRGLTVVVERTRPSGPVRVTAVHNTTNRTEPADAVVSVAGSRVGRTGADGVLWTVAPRGSVTVAATVGNRTVTVTRFVTSAGSPNRTAAVAGRSEAS